MLITECIRTQYIYEFVFYERLILMISKENDHNGGDSKIPKKDDRQNMAPNRDLMMM